MHAKHKARVASGAAGPDGSAARLLRSLARRTHFSEAELAYVRQVFNLYATRVAGSDSVLLRPNFCEIMTAAYPGLRRAGSAVRLIGLFNAFDMDDSAAVSLAEFALGLSCLTRGGAAERARFLFRAYDIHNAGAISREALVLWASPGSEDVTGVSFMHAARFADDVLLLCHTQHARSVAAQGMGGRGTVSKVATSAVTHLARHDSDGSLSESDTEMRLNRLASDATLGSLMGDFGPTALLPSRKSKRTSERVTRKVFVGATQASQLLHDILVGSAVPGIGEAKPPWCSSAANLPVTAFSLPALKVLWEACAAGGSMRQAHTRRQRRRRRGLDGDDIMGLGQHVAEVGSFQSTVGQGQPAMSLTAFRRFMQDVCGTSHELLPLVNRAFQVIDASGEGLIDWTELFGTLDRVLAGSLHDRAAFYFAVYDFNGDGELGLEELRHLFLLAASSSAAAAAAWGEDEDEASGGGGMDDPVAASVARSAVNAMKSFDGDSDGMVTASEFVAACAANPSLLECAGSLFGVAHKYRGGGGGGDGSSVQSPSSKLAAAQQEQEAGSASASNSPGLAAAVAQETAGALGGVKLHQLQADVANLALLERDGASEFDSCVLRSCVAHC